uniref:Arylesterase n=1 Tax=Anthurium amnicola TaxID=1678845 RepID=A0A1D1Z4N5_9ARAE
MAGLTALTISAAAAALLGRWVYKALLRPPPPRICGSPGGPPVTSPRVQLRDGRHLAYREWGVPRAEARHRIVVIHGFDSSKDFCLNASQELVEALGIYFVSFDRAGYGESDPNAGRTVESDAMDIRELADQLGLGDRFYVIGVSIGGYPAWACIKHIPHRLAGVALIAPVVNFWWPSLPEKLAREAYAKVQAPDRRAFWVARHTPRLLYSYMTQKLVTPTAAAVGHPDVFSHQDKEILRMLAANPSPNKARQQGEHESLHRDLMLAFGDWGFEPMHLPDPFPAGNRGSSVHIWHGSDDRMIAAELQRHVAGTLPWVRYHECAGCGHLFVYLQSWSDAILKALLLGEEAEQPAASG